MPQTSHFWAIYHSLDSTCQVAIVNLCTECQMPTFTDYKNMEGTGIPQQKAGCLPILSDILSYKQQHQTPQKNSQQQEMSPTGLIMATLWYTAGHYIFALWFLSSFFFFLA